MEPVKVENTHPTKLCSDKERLSDNLPRVKEQLLQPLSVPLKLLSTPKVESKSCFKAKSVESDVEPVSYTHLTLPTILRV